MEKDSENTSHQPSDSRVCFNANLTKAPSQTIIMSNMEDYNTTHRRGSMLGSANPAARRGSFFGFHWAGEDDHENENKSPVAHRRASLQYRYKDMEHVTQRRGSIFGNHHSSENHSPEKSFGNEVRRASLFGKHQHHNSGEGCDHQRRSFFTSHHNRRGSVGPMATLSSVTAKSRRSSLGGFFGGTNKVHANETDRQDLAYQVMAAFADFDV